MKALLAAAALSLAVATPADHKRGTEQSFLTYPEWFLVHSPAEYAQFVTKNTPDNFPFLGHVVQFWNSYKIVSQATSTYPFNGGYHLMIMVIGSSTTVEYMLRSAYETLFGRISAMSATHGLSEEDRYGAKVAQEYVDFIRAQPWYEFDFSKRLAGLWSSTSLWGPDALRKWERKYALTTEYIVKAMYGQLIKLGTKISYEAPQMSTTVIIDGAPDDIKGVHILNQADRNTILASFPRYQGFTTAAKTAAELEINFLEIAGNKRDLLITVLAKDSWQPIDRVLFTQPILTRPGQKRLALIIQVPALSTTITKLQKEGVELEHIYDY